MSRHQKIMKRVFRKLQQEIAQGELDQQQVEDMESSIKRMQHAAVTQNRREMFKAIESLAATMLRRP